MKNLEKLKKFLKVPALCCACGLFAVLLIALIVISTKPYSLGAYTSEEKFLGHPVKYEFTFKDNENAVDIISAEGHRQEETYKYKIVDGKLYIAPTFNPNNFSQVGKINAFEFSRYESGISMVFTNRGAVGARAALIVFMVLSAGGAIASGVYIVLSKKKKTTKAQANTAAQN